MKASTYWLVSAACIIVSVALWPILGRAVFAGTALGLMSGVLGVSLLVAFVNLISTNHISRKLGVLLIFTGFFVKVPLMIAAAYIAYRIDPIAIWPFTISMLVVYSVLIWQASRRMLY